MKKNAKLIVVMLTLALVFSFSIFATNDTRTEANAAGEGAPVPNANPTLTLKFDSDAQIVFQDGIDALGQPKYKTEQGTSINPILFSGTVGSSVTFTLIPGNKKFVKWANGSKDGPDVGLIAKEIMGVENGVETGLITKFEFTYTFKNTNEIYFCVTNQAYVVSVNADVGATAYFDTINGRPLVSVNNPTLKFTKAYIEKGDDVVVKITLAEGYDLNNIKMSLGNLVKVSGSANEFTYTISNFDPQYNAIPVVCTRKEYSVNVIAPDPVYGSIELSHAAPYYKGDNITVKVLTKSDSGVEFSKLLINGQPVANANPLGYQFTIDGSLESITISAEFVPISVTTKRYTVTINNVPNISGFEYNKTGAGTYVEGTPVRVVFSSEKLNFEHWEVVVGGVVKPAVNQDVYEFVINADVVLTPIASVKTFTIVKENLADSNIKISLSSKGNNIYAIGELVTLTYAEDGLEGKKFDYWTNNGNRMAGSSSSRQMSFNVSSSLVVGAKISELPPPIEEEVVVKIKISVRANNSGMGGVTSSNGSDISVGGLTTLGAYPSDGYEFIAWEKDGIRITTERVTTVENITASASFVAIFQPKKCDIIYSSNVALGGTCEGATKVYSGQTQQIIVKANKGYVIESIFVNGFEQKIDNDKVATITVSNIIDSQNIQINYKKKGLTSTEMTILILTIVLASLFIGSLLFVGLRKPNPAKLERLINARRAALQATGQLSDDESADVGQAYDENVSPDENYETYEADGSEDNDTYYSDDDNNPSEDEQ
ncbi:MAG: hypothetical protein RR033_02450 [Clostridia bacterium]